MSIASDVIAGVLGVSGFDITEEYARLLEDWYGEDLSLLDHNDDDLAAAVWRLTNSIAFWRMSPRRMTPYERLRSQYEALIDQHQALMEDHRELHAELDRIQLRHHRTVRKSRLLRVTRRQGTATEGMSKRLGSTAA